MADTIYRLDGPDYALTGQTIIFTPVNTDQSAAFVEIMWYKDGLMVKMAAASESGAYEYTLTDVTKADEGTYWVEMTTGTGMVLPSAKTTLTIGETWKDPVLVVNINPVTETNGVYKTSVNYEYVPLVKEITPSFFWYDPTGKIVSTNMLLTINELTSDNSGDYTVVVSYPTFGGYKAISETTSITIGTTEEYPLYYIHDLLPARNSGYIWMGWWVHDEIKKAQADSFDWMKDPTNDRFKYKAYLLTLVRGFDIWADLDMQESRNGYILHKKDVIVSA